MQRFIVGVVSLVLAFGWFWVRDVYQSWQPMPDLPLTDVEGRPTSLDRARSLNKPTVVVYLPGSMMACPGIQTAGRVARELFDASGKKALVIGVAENTNAAGIRAVKTALALPFPIYAVGGEFTAMRPLMNALSESKSAMSRRTIAGASVVLDLDGKILHRTPDGQAKGTIAFLATR